MQVHTNGKQIMSAGLPRSTLIDTLHRAGWTGAAVLPTKTRCPAPSRPRTVAAAARERK